MKRFLFTCAVLVFVVLCAACMDVHEEAVSPTSSVSPTFPPLNFLYATSFVLTPTPTATATSTPFPTRMPLPPVFVREGIPPIQPQEAISVDNAYDIQELARWGYGAINKVEHSKDGQYMFVQTSMGVYAYHAGTLDEIWRYPVDAGASAFDVGSQYLAVGTYSGEIILLDVADGSEIGGWEAHRGAVLDIDFSMDETLLVSGSDDTYMRLWTMKPGPVISMKLEVKDDYNYSIEDVFFCGETNMVVMLSYDNYRGDELIDTDSGEVLRNVMGLFSPENDLYLYYRDIRRISDDKLVAKLDDEKLDEIVFTYLGHTFSNNGEMLAMGGEGEEEVVVLFSMSDGSLIAVFEEETYYSSSGGHLAKPALRGGPGLTGGIRSLNFSPDDKYLAAINRFGNTYILDLEMKTVKLITKQGFEEAIFSPTGKQIISYSSDGLSLYEVSTGNQVGGIADGWSEFYFGYGSEIYFSPVSAHLGYGAHVWEIDEGKREDLPWGERLMGFSGNGQYVYTLRRQWWVAQRRTADFELIKQVQLERPEEESDLYWYDSDLAWWELSSWRMSPDGTIIRAGSYDTPYLVWDVNTGDFVEFTGNSLLHHTEFSNDGRYMAENSCGVFYVSEQQLNGEYEWVHTIYNGDISGSINNFTFSPMNHLYFATDQTIEIYDPVKGEWVDSFHLGSNYYERSIAISPDESLLAVANYNEISIWDINDEKLLVKFNAHFLYVEELTFSPDGRYLASTSWDGTVRLWGIVP